MHRALVVALVLAVAGPAAAQDSLLRVPEFKLRTPTLDLTSVPLMPLSPAAATPSIVLPPRYSFALDDGRAFWFAAGASSVVALGTHVLVGIPTFAIGATAASGAAASSPAAQVPLILGLSGAYVLAESALASLAAMLVFNSVSKVYDGNYLVAFTAHVAGTALGAAVSVLPFVTGTMLVTGMGSLAEFTGGAGSAAVIVFSILGALPAVVIGGIALVGVPAIIGAWAMSVSATTKPGFTIDPRWRDPVPVQGAGAPLVTIPL